MTDPAQVSDDTTDRFLREYLENRDSPCPACGYNLRNLTGQRCPECGERIIVQVGLLEPKLFAPIAGLIGLAAGAGFNGLLLTYFLIMTLRDNGPGLDDLKIWMVTGIGLIVLAVAMMIWLRRWRVIRRQQPSRKTFLVLAAWLLTFADIVVFSFTIK